MRKRVETEYEGGGVGGSSFISSFSGNLCLPLAPLIYLILSPSRRGKEGGVGVGELLFTTALLPANLSPHPTASQVFHGKKNRFAEDTAVT